MTQSSNTFNRKFENIEDIKSKSLNLFNEQNQNNLRNENLN